MTSTIDAIYLENKDQLSPAEMAAAYINQTQRSVFLTGKAGTGKTTFLRDIIHHTHKNAIIVAPTGIAAINAQGVTIHSQFGLPFGAFVPDRNFRNTNEHIQINSPANMFKHLHIKEYKRKVIKELELLIIDEVSMLRADILDAIDFALKFIRKNYDAPFGGVQVLFIGDMMQLPPVVKEGEWQILSSYYQSPFFFDAHCLKDNKPVYIELDKIYRQNDPTFVNLLNNLRYNRVTNHDIEILNRYVDKDFDATKALNTITLTTHNYKADEINKSSLNAISGLVYNYVAKIEGEFPVSMMPLDNVLALKKGAQIMFVKNDISGSQRYFNGKIGVVHDLNEEEIMVDFGDGKLLHVEMHEWKNIRYTIDEVSGEMTEEVIGSFIQFPIKLAWAITIHKSQGLTFERAILDVNKAFAPGQVYVALSRLKSLEGLVLTSSIEWNSIKQHECLVNHANEKLASQEAMSLLNKEAMVYLQEYIPKAFKLKFLYLQFKQHLDTYSDADNSNKGKQIKWAKNFLDQIEPLMQPSEKFGEELMSIFGDRSCLHYQLVDRTRLARNYFFPILMQLSNSILKHVIELGSVKQMKNYIEELLQFESLFFKQAIMIEKSVCLVENMFLGKPIGSYKEVMRQSQADRVNELKNANFTLVNSLDKVEASIKMNSSQRYWIDILVNEKRNVKLAKNERSPKVDTFKLSFDLYQSGKSIHEIAKEHSLAVSTIQGHLEKYVGLGQLSFIQFLSQEKYEIIKEMWLKHEKPKALKTIKELLGPDYSYSDIRMAISEYERTLKNESIACLSEMNV